MLGLLGDRFAASLQRLQVKTDRFLRVSDGVLQSIALTKATGERRDGHPVATLVRQDSE